MYWDHEASSAKRAEEGYSGRKFGVSVPHAAEAPAIPWLRESRPEALARLYQAADEVRRKYVGDAVHLRGLIEISNHCRRMCLYCGLRAGNRDLQRYRMPSAEILDCARTALRLGYGTVVLQAGEDEAITGTWLAEVVRQIKAETGLAVTLSMGERSMDDLALWREAGADRYLLRFETSDPALFRVLHPSLAGQQSDRVALLRLLRELGYEIGGGVMIGIPGQSFTTLARDIELFRELDLDMVGVGPYISHPATPLGNGFAGKLTIADQVPNSEEMTYKVIALTRLVRPTANIPSTTALASINRVDGRERGLAAGANVVMPNLTPLQYRPLYEIYPNKACVYETGEQCAPCLEGRIRSMGRVPGTGPGGRITSVVSGQWPALLPDLW
jgi:biotin synthase